MSRKCDALGFTLSPVRHQKIKRKGEESHLFLEETALLLTEPDVLAGPRMTGRLAWLLLSALGNSLQLIAGNSGHTPPVLPDIGGHGVNNSHVSQSGDALR